MEIVLGEKGKKIILLNGFKFHFQKNLANGIQRWSCNEKKCACFLKLSETNEIVNQNVLHNHDKVEIKVLNRQISSNELKRKAVDESALKPSTLICRELRDKDIDTLTTKDIKLIRNKYARKVVYQSILDLPDPLYIDIKTNKSEDTRPLSA